MGFLGASIQVALPLIINPMIWIGVVAGSFIGWGFCWIVFVLPFQKNLGEREAQLDHWSALNQQLQQLTMDNRGMSQVELKQYVASNQEAAAAFAEIQHRLQERELRLSETPVWYVLLPISVLAVAFGGAVLLFNAMNQRAQGTIEHVMQLAPPDLVREVVQRHLMLTGTRDAGRADRQQAETGLIRGRGRDDA
jgi:hypothetical protein